VEDPSQLEVIFSKELQQASAVVARNVTVRIELAEGVRLIDVLGRPMRQEGNTATATLFDLAGGQTARFVARFRVQAEGGNVLQPIARVELAYSDPRGSEAHTADLALGAQVTGDPQLVAAHADSTVETETLHAIGAREMIHASEELQQGHRSEALGVLDNVRALFGASANALAGDTGQIDQARRQMAAAQTDDDVSRAAKATHMNALKNFGQNLDTY
jgi:Ca-activated chloride channel family protein